MSLPPRWRRELQDYDTLWQAQTIGYDALVLITGSENPVDSLSLDQIRDIYAGKITNWKQVGRTGPADPDLRTG